MRKNIINIISWLSVLIILTIIFGGAFALILTLLTTKFGDYVSMVNIIFSTLVLISIPMLNAFPMALTFEAEEQLHHTAIRLLKTIFVSLEMVLVEFLAIYMMYHLLGMIGVIAAAAIIIVAIVNIPKKINNAH